MDKKSLKRLIYTIGIIIIALLSYKIYLISSESNFHESNYKNMKMIQNGEQKASYSFAIVGSIKNSIDVFQDKMINDINADKSIGFVISTGNSVLDGTEDKYRILNKSLSKLTVPYLMGLGESEISDGGGERFYKHFGPFYYSFVYDDSYFIFIDTTGMTSADWQKDWIVNELVKADNYSRKFVFMNDSPVEPGNQDLFADSNYIKKEGFRSFLKTQFSKHKVTGVFTNGSTDYEKKVIDGVSYYLSGGAGGVLLDDSTNSSYHYLKVDVTGDKVVVEPQAVSLNATHSITRRIESLWIFIHSIFYAQFINILLLMFGVLLLFLVLYRKVSKEVHYYRNFTGSGKAPVPDGKLNIAMFTNNYFPFLGGVPVSIRRLAIALRNRGNSVVIFAPQYPGAVEAEEGVVRCKLLNYRKTNKFDFAIANIYSPDINREFIKNKYDVIHVHHPFWMGKRGLKLGLKYDIPVVLTYHTRLEMYSENLPIFKMVFKNILSHRMTRKFAQKCDAVIAPTLSVKEYLVNVGVSRQKLVLPTGIDFEKYNVIDDDFINNIRLSQAPNGETLLCSVSRLAVEKNINFLIRGLKYVKENTDVRFKCMIIGNGPERENIKNLVDEYSLSDDILLIGSVDPEKIAGYYLASDLFVFSSVSETQGMVLLEAMAGKCPVACIRSSGTDDVIKDGYNGYKTPMEIEAWAEKVICLLENKNELETMGSNALLYAQNYSMEKMAERVESFYKKTIQTRNEQPRESKDA
ncbi:glycosyltransferase [Sinanaerobacter chloroacetimidivorans]|uniref:Glycosyltransferase n=1 Tax=Sinanaerobacter chloroacetimidivorans TaxID=2818044 RepID=A0A8J7W387_9FIRM|nr:glycosyltransferase [Sinanaerobacter chloroacetimidivorans]MBR0598455.1 glycosyltransferase [Sinanaerobacter chloroacetimidivorans]